MMMIDISNYNNDVGWDDQGGGSWEERGRLEGMGREERWEEGWGRGEGGDGRGIGRGGDGRGGVEGWRVIWVVGRGGGRGRWEE